MKVKIVILLLIVVALFYITWTNGYRAHTFMQNDNNGIQKSKSASTGKDENFPFFKCVSLDGDTLNIIPKINKSRMVIFFDPSCSFCEETVKVLKRYRKEFSQTEILMISTVSSSEIISFKKDQNLQSFDNITFLRSDYNSFYEAFKTTYVPAILIYSRSGILLSRIEESVGAKVLVKYTRAANEL